MLADFNDGPEHSTLQSEAGYIDARPQADRSTKLSCNARPHHTLRSENLWDGSHGRSDLRAFCAMPRLHTVMGGDTALKYSDQKRKRRSSRRGVAPGVRSYPSRVCPGGK